MSLVFCCHRSNPDKIATLVVNSTISSQEKAAEPWVRIYYLRKLQWCRWWCLSILVGTCLHEAL